MGQGMKIDRFISTGPRRSTEQACAEISDFVGEVTQERSVHHAEDVRLALGKVLPLLRLLLPTRRFADPAFSVEMPELSISLYVGYDPDSKDDLSVPGLTLVDKLDPQDVITITLRTTAEVTGGLARLPEAASTGRVKVRLAVSPAEDAPQDSARDDDGETDPTFAADAEPTTGDDENDENAAADQPEPAGPPPSELRRSRKSPSLPPGAGGRGPPASRPA